MKINLLNKWRYNKLIFDYIWNTLVIVSTSFLAIVIPLDLEYNVFNNTWLSGINLCIYAIYFIDILVCKDRILHTSSTNNFQEKAYARNPFRRWIYADIIALIPFHLIFGMPFLALLRLAKIPKVLSYLQYFRYYMVRYSTTITGLYFAFCLIHLSHWVSCGWLLLIKQDPNLDTTSNYIRALYWSVTTLTTVGFGDITPNINNNSELIYTMIVQLMGVGVYGLVIGNVAGLIAKNDPAKIQYLENIEKLKALIRSRRLPPHLQHKIRDYFTYLWQNRLGYDETSFLKKLPDNLQQELSMHLKSEIVEQIDIFKGASDNFIKEIAMFLEPELVTPEDIIFKKGDVGSAMYFLVRGTLKIIDDEGKVINIMHGGDFFGEIALFMQTPRSATVASVTYCDLYKLKKNEFDKVIENYPQIASKIKQQAIIRRQRYF
ncbi:cyclic nucleotide-gated ion channel [Chondrinema litorale]|uniref:cyclic nucleotide-gated ion channel n=1 Tax=Chondrinema litorale TaxID=2994555 RepID=UPI002544964D|nr:cyclic nucleotide-gated ion channel [Chondrinema litorale]UZR94539.1 cyclic nucleotide-binding domain-containing protein [Chondrinema litorale]